MGHLVKLYFKLGLQQKEIVSCLYINHNINITQRHSRRILQKFKLYRRKNYSNLETVAEFIETNIGTYNQLHGYKWMHLRCLQNNLIVTQEVVRLLLHVLDPEGVDIRSRKRLRRRQYRNKGPNFLWHMDCYDKLKPFGICISGCIDGFSRKIIWLNAGTNSNNPRIIASHYIETLKSLGGCPNAVRADLGTENEIVEIIQKHLRMIHGNNETSHGLPAFLYGSSPANQRIECWWSMLRKHHSQYWLNVFHQLKDEGSFSGSQLDKTLIQMCFINIIQKELASVVLEWNLHKISGSRNSVSPRGRPFMMYHLPEIYGTHDYLCRISDEDIEENEDICIVNKFSNCDKDVCELGLIIMYENNLNFPEDPNDAVDLYILLRSKIYEILEESE